MNEGQLIYELVKVTGEAHNLKRKNKELEEEIKTLKDLLEEKLKK